MKFKYISADNFLVKDFLQKISSKNAVRWQKDLKCWFACKNPRTPIPTCKLYSNCKLYPFLKHILSVFHFVWFLSCALAVYGQMIYFQSRHVDKMRISYKNWGGHISVRCDLWLRIYLCFFLEEWSPSKEIHIYGTFTLTCSFFPLFLTLLNKFHDVYLDNLYKRAKCVHLSYTHHNCVKV